jgi:hypothetical protein
MDNWILCHLELHILVLGFFFWKIYPFLLHCFTLVNTKHLDSLIVIKAKSPICQQHTYLHVFV